MKLTDAIPPYETSEIGTPRDYTSDMYYFYFEVGEINDAALKIIQKYLGPERSKRLRTLPFGYEMELPLQSAPDIVRELVTHNIAVYQVVRYAKSNTVWA